LCRIRENPSTFSIWSTNNLTNSHICKHFPEWVHRQVLWILRVNIEIILDQTATYFLKKIYFTVSSNLVISVDIFWAEIYRGRLFFRAEWVEIISPIEIRIHHFLSGKNNNTLHKIDTSQTVYRMFFFFVQLNNYISNLSLLKYFIQKIYGKRDISQQVVTLSKFGNARIWYYEKF
jgi:hypothetical protein